MTIGAVGGRAGRRQSRARCREDEAHAGQLIVRFGVRHILSRHEIGRNQKEEALEGEWKGPPMTRAA
jgi:hypothetical protein